MGALVTQPTLSSGCTVPLSRSTEQNPLSAERTGRMISSRSDAAGCYRTREVAGLPIGPWGRDAIDTDFLTHRPKEVTRCLKSGFAFAVNRHIRRRPTDRETDAPPKTLTTKHVSTKVVIRPPASAPAVGPYNHAVRVGNLLFSAGQIPLDPATGKLVPGDIKLQTERVLENVKTILEHQELTFANVVKTTVFLTNLAEFAAMNEVYAKYFTTDFPARSTVQVAALPRGASVEIEVIAHY